MNIEDKYVKEISDEFGNLEYLEAGSEEYCNTVDGIAKLTDKFIDLKKLDIEQQKMEEERKDRKVKNGIGIASVAVPSGITIVGMVLMFLFEEKGTIVGRTSNKIVERIFRMK
jgi:hypothetical protein